MENIGASILSIEDRIEILIQRMKNLSTHFLSDVVLLQLFDPAYKISVRNSSLLRLFIQRCLNIHFQKIRPLKNLAPITSYSAQARLAINRTKVVAILTGF